MFADASRMNGDKNDHFTILPPHHTEIDDTESHCAVDQADKSILASVESHQNRTVII